MSTEQKDKTPRTLVADLYTAKFEKKAVESNPRSEQRTIALWNLDNRVLDIRSQIGQEKNR